MYYYLSIGTNIHPKENAVAIVKALCLAFENVTLYPFICTSPEDMTSQNSFLNSVAIITSPNNIKDIKLTLNRIETNLGRDRQDPDRSTKDRPADIDILSQSTDLDPVQFEKFGQKYIKNAYLMTSKPVDLTKHGLTALKGPSTVHLDCRSSNIVIRHQHQYRLENGLKPTLKS